jgi:hypothetical protein
MFNVGDVVVFTSEAKMVYADWPSRHNEFKVVSVYNKTLNFCNSGAEKKWLWLCHIQPSYQQLSTCKTKSVS